jgi:hypothetical protein
MADGCCDADLMVGNVTVVVDVLTSSECRHCLIPHLHARTFRTLSKHLSCPDFALYIELSNTNQNIMYLRLLLLDHSSVRSGRQITEVRDGTDHEYVSDADIRVGFYDRWPFLESYYRKVSGSENLESNGATDL